MKHFYYQLTIILDKLQVLSENGKARMLQIICIAISVTYPYIACSANQHVLTMYTV